MRNTARFSFSIRDLTATLACTGSCWSIGNFRGSEPLRGGSRVGRGQNRVCARKEHILLNYRGHPSKTGFVVLAHRRLRLKTFYQDWVLDRTELLLFECYVASPESSLNTYWSDLYHQRICSGLYRKGRWRIFDELGPPALRARSSWLQHLTWWHFILNFILLQYKNIIS